MCGICGVKFSEDQNILSLDKNDFFNFNYELLHRGPDFQDGIILDKLFLGSTRLKILDLDNRSNMPMSDDQNILLFNGEIYNYKDLKNRLISLGETFKTTSDTEVILKLFKIYGTSSFDMLEGMFAIAIFNLRKKKLYLTRDIFGIKPLFYYQDKEKFIFSSEEDHIAKYVNNTEISEFAIYSYLKKGSVLQPFTKYKKIKSILPGEVFAIDQKNKVQISSFNNIKKIIIEAENSDIKFNKENFIDTIKLEIKKNLCSDVKNSLMLSSGIDSLFIYKQIKDTASTFTLSSEEYRNKEVDEIKNLSDLGIDVTKSKYLEKEYSYDHLLNKNFSSRLSLDGPQYYLLSQLISQNNIKVALSGIGGDEMLNSYPSFKYIPILLRLNNFFPLLKKFKTKNYRFEKFLRIIQYQNISDVYLEFRSSFSDKEITKILKNFKSVDSYRNIIIEDFKNKTSGIKKIRNKIKSLELNIYLRDQVLKEVDYFSMLNSVETRVPFLSKKVLFYSSLPDAQNTISKKLLINDVNFFKNKKYKKIPFLIEDLIMKNYKSKMINKAKNLII